MQFQTLFAFLTFSTAALGLAKPQGGYGRPSVCSTTTTLSTTKTRTVLRRPTTTVTNTESITVSTTISPSTCPTTCDPASTVTTTYVETSTITPPTCPVADPSTVTTTSILTSSVVTTITPSTCPSAPSTVTTTLLSTSTETQNQTITSTSTQVSTSTEIQNQTITSTATQVSTVASTTTSTLTETATSTATPGPVVELVAFRRASCGVQPVTTSGNSPNFQTIQLSYDATRRQSQCVRIGQQSPQSFWWDTVSFAPVPSGCHLYFYSGDSCFDDGPGGQQISLNNGRGSCRNLNGIAQSVQLFC